MSFLLFNVFIKIHEYANKMHYLPLIKRAMSKL